LDQKKNVEELKTTPYWTKQNTKPAGFNISTEFNETYFSNIKKYELTRLPVPRRLDHDSDEAASYFRRLVAGFPQRWPRFEPGSANVGFMVDKVRWGRFYPSTSVSFANLNSTSTSTVTIIYHLGLVQQASSGRSTKWTQSHSTRNNKRKINKK
jgi:hypothetical protein